MTPAKQSENLLYANCFTPEEENRMIPCEEVHRKSLKKSGKSTKHCPEVMEYNPKQPSILNSKSPLKIEEYQEIEDQIQTHFNYIEFTEKKSSQKEYVANLENVEPDEGLNLKVPVIENMTTLNSQRSQRNEVGNFRTFDNPNDVQTQCMSGAGPEVEEEVVMVTNPRQRKVATRAVAPRPIKRDSKKMPNNISDLNIHVDSRCLAASCEDLPTHQATPFVVQEERLLANDSKIGGALLNHQQVFNPPAACAQNQVKPSQFPEEGHSEQVLTPVQLAVSNMHGQSL